MIRQLVDRLMKSVPGRVLSKFLEDQAPNWAALIAWNALFALFPIVLFAVSLLGFVLNLFGQANTNIYKLIFSAIPTDPHQQLQLVQAVEGVKHQSGVFFVVGLIGLLWGGSALFGIMEQAFAVIYHSKPRDFIRQKLIAFGMVLLFTLLVGVAVIGSTLITALNKLPPLPFVPSFLYSGFAAVLGPLIGVVAGFLLFLAIYFVIPNREQDVRKVLPGAIFSGILFEVITLLFPLYLGINRGINQYGSTFALLFLLMTFLFFVGIITMLGVELNSVIYPVKVEQPARGDTITAAPTGSRDGDRRGTRAVEHGVNGHDHANGRRGIPARAALGLAVIASVVGVILGRRTSNGG